MMNIKEVNDILFGTNQKPHSLQRILSTKRKRTEKTRELIRCRYCVKMSVQSVITTSSLSLRSSKTSWKKKIGCLLGSSQITYVISFYLHGER